MKTVDKLATLLLQLLQTSRNVTVEQHPCQGWCRPKPSRLTFHLVHTLRLLAWFKGWVWTSDVLIRAHLWPILQTWNSKKDSVPEATVMAVVRLLGKCACTLCGTVCPATHCIQRHHMLHLHTSGTCFLLHRIHRSARCRVRNIVSITFA